MTAHLVELLDRAATESPAREALVEPASGRRTTWADLDAQVRAVARGLNGLGLVAGYRVVLATSNRLESVVCYLAALRAGLVAVPLDPRSSTGDLVRLAVDCGARLLVADGPAVTTARQAVAGLEDALVGADDELLSRTTVPRVLVTGGPALPGELRYDDLLAAGGTDAPLTADPERLAVLMPTSGTSGRPRAAMLTHRALLANLDQAAAVQPPLLTADDVVLGVLPLSHVHGLNAVLGQVLHQQARLVLEDGFDAERTLAVVAEQGVTVLPLAPAVFQAWRDVPDLRARLAGVRLVVSGAAPLPVADAEAFTARTGLVVHQGYGLTEAAPMVTSTLVGADPAGGPGRGSVGAPLPGVELRLADEAGEAPEGGDDPGEVLVRGANLFSGYWPDGAGGPDQDGWFGTGDLGFLGPDGDLFLVDRLIDLVVVSGFSVYPSEVEDVVEEVDAVAEAVVVGEPDPDTGQAVVAYVRPAPGAPTEPDVLAAAVREHCARRLARFKRPVRVQVVDRLPRTGTGAVSRARLRAADRRRDEELLR